MGLADGVAADDERNSFLVVHRHAGERLANVLRCKSRVRVAARPLGIHVDQAHVIGGERSLEFSPGGVALVSEPCVLSPPDDLVGLPDVGAPEPEAECLEPHRFIGHIAGEDDEISPGDLAAVLLFDRPQQPAGLVEVRVVRPAVERGKALSTLAATAASVGDAVRSRGMPAHPDEQRPIMAVVGRPPVLRCCHQRDEVALQRLDVQRLERFL